MHFYICCLSHSRLSSVCHDSRRYSTHPRKYTDAFWGDFLAFRIMSCFYQSCFLKTFTEDQHGSILTYSIRFVLLMAINRVIAVDSMPYLIMTLHPEPLQCVASSMRIKTFIQIVGKWVINEVSKDIGSCSHKASET